MTEVVDKITIKDLADELDVSKTTIRNHMKKLPDGLAVTEKDGVIVLDADVVSFIRESVMLSKMKVSGKATGKVSSEIVIDFPQSQFPTDETFEFLKKQLEEKDNQLKVKDQMIQELLQDLRNHQKTFFIQQEKTQQILLENDALRKKKWWRFWQ